MNKKQLIMAWLKNNIQLTILWIMGIAICALFLITPKKLIYEGPNNTELFVGLSKLCKKPTSFLYNSLCWDRIIPSAVTILIIGGLLIYTLKEKKK